MMEEFNLEETTLMALRKRAGLTQEALARAMGKSTSTIVKWEAGREPSLTPREFKRLKALLNCSYEDIVDAFCPKNTENA